MCVRRPREALKGRVAGHDAHTRIRPLATEAIVRAGHLPAELGDAGRGEAGCLGCIADTTIGSNTALLGDVSSLPNIRHGRWFYRFLITAAQVRRFFIGGFVERVKFSSEIFRKFSQDTN